MQDGTSQQWHSSAGSVCMTKYCVCRFCERIIPVQITCSLTQQALTSATQRLAKLHAKQAVESSGDQLVKFAGQSTIFLRPNTVYGGCSTSWSCMCVAAMQPAYCSRNPNSHAEEIRSLELTDSHQELKSTLRRSCDTLLAGGNFWGTFCDLEMPPWSVGSNFGS